MSNEIRDYPVRSQDNLSRFLGGSPIAVAFRLILLSILVGVVLSAIGFDPLNIITSIRLLVQRLYEYRLRRLQLAVALFPARRRDRDPGLVAVARIRAARPMTPNSRPMQSGFVLSHSHDDGLAAFRCGRA